MNNYTVNFDEESISEIAIQEWVLSWCKNHHPEVFDRAREFIRLQLKKEHEGAV